MFKFAISGLIKNISFAIDKIKVIKIVFNELFIFIIIIAINKYNDIIFFNYEYITLFIHYIINNQIEFNYLRIIKYINLNINYYKDIVNFIESYKEKLNEIRFR